MHQLRETHWLAAMKILTYIKSSPRKGLMYRKHEHVRISEYSDSGYVDNRGDENLLLAIAPLLEEI